MLQIQHMMLNICFFSLLFFYQAFSSILFSLPVYLCWRFLQKNISDCCCYSGYSHSEKWIFNLHDPKILNTCLFPWSVLKSSATKAQFSPEAGSFAWILLSTLTVVHFHDVISPRMILQVVFQTENQTFCGGHFMDDFVTFQEIVKTSGQT